MRPCHGHIDDLPLDLPPIRAGEIDGRYVDFTSDLGPPGDQIPSLGVVSVAIVRTDGFPSVPGTDLMLAGSDWPNTLDPTQLILTIGLNAPSASAGSTYQVTITVNKTLQGRLFIRDLMIDVLALMG